MPITITPHQWAIVVWNAENRSISDVIRSDSPSEDAAYRYFDRYLDVPSEEFPELEYQVFSIDDIKRLNSRRRSISVGCV